MIERAAFSNFKSLRAVSCTFERFTVIVGANGSGKTSILDGLHYLAQSTYRQLGQVLRGNWSPGNLRSRGTSDDTSLELGGSLDGHEMRVAIRVSIPENEPEASAWATSETECDKDTWTATVEREWAGEKSIGEHTPATRNAPPQRPLRELARALGSTRKLRLDPLKLSAPSYNEQPEKAPRLDFTGEGLASVLADLALRDPDTFQDIQSAARQVVPSLERIRMRSATVYRSELQQIPADQGSSFERQVERRFPGHQLVLDFKGAPDVLAPLASEGTLLAIGLLTALLAEPRPRLLLLDDIDQALHPRAQGALVLQIGRILEARPDLQIIATSHSPYLLDHLDPEQVLLTAIKPDGSTACAGLSEHPDLARWRDIAKTGELWSFVGEDWLLERAAREKVG
ncbi:AAA family ATPase [Chondromyces apiculatus]|uniref:AAA+ ATPase domain-containing protein n=1 Tax=Chondromyces apiculatus DSM 436 TaxID=1192034 RepID=A0A017T8R2_9BACT|nr:ATP-binding protein [Chondromyces apiculatus]EYF05200.1 Hypothetical protein CAP_3565 [Chondromyces apiculatus DSM 436]